MDAKKLIELRKQAEKAVEDMQDGEFKLKAFEVILNHLLSPGKTEPTSGKHRESREPNRRDMSRRKRTPNLRVEESWF